MTPQSAGSFEISYGEDDPGALDFGVLSSAMPSVASMNVNGVVVPTAPVTVPANVTKWKVSVSSATGVFTGSFSLSDVIAPSSKPTVRTVSFAGILRQPPRDEESGTIGGGYLLLPSLQNPSTGEKSSGKILFTLPSQ